MILVTVGTQLAFDRLVSAVDAWSGNNPHERVFAQIGPAQFVPKYLEHQDFVPPDQANSLFREASLIVAHAGMGSILTALRFQKPIVILPRRASLNEHRNDHQMATAKWLAKRQGITVVWDETELLTLLDQREKIQVSGGIPEFASPELIENIRRFLR